MIGTARLQQVPAGGLQVVSSVSVIQVESTRLYKAMTFPQDLRCLKYSLLSARRLMPQNAAQPLVLPQQQQPCYNRRSSVACAMFHTTANLHRETTEEHQALRQRWMPDSIGWRSSDEWRVPTNVPPCGTAIRDGVETEELATIIDGKAIAEQIRAEIKEEVEAMKAKVGHVPGLAVVLVGSRKDSQSYVRSKKAACEEAGIASFGVELPEEASEAEVLQAVEQLNADPRVHGVLVQLPLPKHINEEAVLAEVSINKDVDGFHPLNMGRLAMAGREPLFVPCTPKGCLELLLRTGVNIRGKQAVVIGRSNVVGMPAALLLQRHNATVTIVHSATEKPEEITRQADIVIAAAGVPNLVRATWLKPGAVVIDVGINPVEDLSTKRGYRLVGDVCFDEARQVASAITPVPKGVGPMTIAMLLSNTLTAAKRAYGLV